jgi:hypothetical protein
LTLSGNFIQTAGTLTLGSGGVLSLGGNYSATGGTINADPNSELALNSSSGTIAVPVLYGSFGKLAVNGTYTGDIPAVDALTVNGTYAGDIPVVGTLTVNGTCTAGGGIHVSGDVDVQAGTLTLISGNLLAGGDVTIQGGGALALANGSDNGAGRNWTAAGTLTATGSRINFTGTGIIDNGINSFGDLVIAAGADYTVTGDIRSLGDLRVEGILRGNVLTIETDGRVTAAGTGAKILTQNLYIRPIDPGRNISINDGYTPALYINGALLECIDAPSPGQAAVSIGSSDGAGSFYIGGQGGIGNAPLVCSLTLLSPRSTGMLSFNFNADAESLRFAGSRTLVIDIGSADVVNAVSGTADVDIAVDTLRVLHARHIGTEAAPLATEIAGMGAVDVSGSLYLKNSSPVLTLRETVSAADVLSLDTTGVLTQNDSPYGDSGVGRILCDSAFITAGGGIDLRHHGVFTNAVRTRVSLVNGPAGGDLLFSNAGSGLTAEGENKSPGATLVISEETGDLELNSSNAAALKSNGGGIILSAGGSKKVSLLKDINSYDGSVAGGSITVKSPLIIAAATEANPIVVSSGDTGGGDILFEGPVETAPGKRNSLSLSAGTGSISFRDTLGLSAAGPAPLGNLTVASAGGLTFQKAVHADGVVDITASGGFVQEMEAPISAGSGFARKGAGTASSIGADITASAGGISFTADDPGANRITVTNTGPNQGVGLSAGGGDIVLGGTLLGPGKNISLRAEEGDAGRSITVTGGIGAADRDRFGTISTEPADRVVIEGRVIAAAFLQKGVLPGDNPAGPGETLFTGPQNYSGGFSFTGNRLTIEDSLETGEGIDISNDGEFRIAGGVTAPGQAMTVRGLTVNNGTVQAGPLADKATAIRFEGDYLGTGGTLRGNTQNNGDPQIVFTGSRVKLGTFEANGDRIVFAGSGDQEFDNDKDSPVGNVTINNPGKRVFLSNPVRQIGGAELAIAAGTLDLQNRYWYTGAVGNPPPVTGGFLGSAGSLSLGPGVSALIAGDPDPQSGSPASDFITEDGYSVTVTAESDIFASGSAVLRGTWDFRGNNRIRVGGSAEAAWTAGGDITRSVIVMFGSSGTSPAGGVGLSASAAIGNLTVGDTGRRPALVELLSDITVRGNLKIREDSILDAGKESAARSILAGGSWIQGKGQGEEFDSAGISIDFPNGRSGVFVCRDSAVQFTGKEIYISGNTTWYDFICESENARIYFSTWFDYRGADPGLDALRHVHTVSNLFRVTRGNQDSRITVTRQPYADRLPHPSQYNYPGDPISKSVTDWDQPENRGKFWDFNLLSGARLEINHIDIYYSHSYRRLAIPRGQGVDVNAAPYWPADGDIAKPHYFNINWVSMERFFYSYTEDHNGNGRIDTIRAQSAFELMPDSGGAFSDFEVSVDGYEIDPARGTGGYNRVWGARGEKGSPPPGDANAANSMYAVYIYLKEKDYDDGDSLLSWRVTKNGSLFDLTTGNILIGSLNETQETVDTVPPRIAYALALPGGNEVYLRTSEPVQNAPGKTIAFEIDDPPGRGIGVQNPPQILSPREYLITLSVPGDAGLSAADLAEGQIRIRMYNAVDFSRRAADENDGDPSAQFPSPSYPAAAWTYGEYETVRFAGPGTEALIPPHKLLASEHAHEAAVNPAAPEAPVSDFAPHRLTDVLISRVPGDAADPRFFIWPVWAKDNPTADPDKEQLAFDTPGFLYRRQNEDFGLIWDFTGKSGLRENTLRPRDITLQALRNRDLDSFEPELYYATDKRVSDTYRARDIHGRKGFWLPPFNENDYNDIVPGPYPADRGENLQAVRENLYNFDLKARHYEGGSRLEFYFLLRHPRRTPLYAGRLGDGTAPWYRRVEPFVIDIRDITLQRSGVTILNNVINPRNGEQTILQYTLKTGGRVTIQVFTLDGNLVKSLVHGSLPAGEYQVTWDGKNRGNREVARGMYFIRAVGPDMDEIRKVMVVK